MKRILCVLLTIAMVTVFVLPMGSCSGNLAANLGNLLGLFFMVYGTDADEDGGKEEIFNAMVAAYLEQQRADESERQERWLARLRELQEEERARALLLEMQTLNNAGFLLSTEKDGQWALARYRMTGAELSKENTLVQYMDTWPPIPQATRGFDPTVSRNQEYLSYLLLPFGSARVLHYSKSGIDFSIQPSTPHDPNFRMQQPRFQQNLMRSSPNSSRSNDPEWYVVVEYSYADRKADFLYMKKREMDDAEGDTLFPRLLESTTLAEWDPNAGADRDKHHVLRFPIYDLSPRITQNNPEIAFLGTAGENGEGPNVLWILQDGAESPRRITHEGIVEYYFPKFDHTGERLAFIGRDMKDEFAVFVTDLMPFSPVQVSDWVPGLERPGFPMWPALQEVVWPRENRSVVFAQYSSPAPIEGRSDQWLYDAQVIEIFINPNNSGSRPYILYNSKLQDPKVRIDVLNAPISVNSLY